MYFVLCKAVLTLNSDKKIFTLYFFSTGSVLGQGEYCQHYQKIFPQMIKNMTQESGFNHINSKDKELQSGDPSTSPEHTNPRDSSLTFTPEKLQDILSNRLRGTPITPQQIVKKHLMKTTERMDNIEDAVVTIQEHQNKQQEKLQEVSTKLDSIKIPNLSGLESKITNAIKDKLEEFVGDRLRKDLDYLIEQLSLKTLEVDTGKEIIKNLKS